MDPNAKYLLRWRGRQQGPFTVEQIEYMLAANKIGMLHEVFLDGGWQTLQAARLLSPAPAGQPAPSPAAAGRQPPPGSATIPAEEALALRWGGKNLGVLGVAEIERQLDRQEIGLLHEVFFENRWLTLNDFFVRRNVLAAQRKNSVPPIPPIPLVAPPPPGKRGGRIVLENLGRTLKGGERILQGINLVVEPNEFIALLGPSGSGKSTLMNAMTGRQRATEGSITINGEDFYRNSWKFREQIGHVPQKDIVHLPLTVCQELTFAARLRLPSLKSRSEIAGRVDAVISQIGLEERRQTKNASLSGGQVKRVSLGVEMLADPRLLFLDEATSGLDAGIEARMMALFHRLANEGRSIVCVTHNLDNVCLCNLVAILVRGRLAYYGPPDELPGYFKIAKVSEVYQCLESASPDEWASRFAASKLHDQYVTGRLKAAPPISGQGLPAPQPVTNGFFHQSIVLTHRYLSVAFLDTKNIIILLAQAPLIAAMLGVAFHANDFAKPLVGEQDENVLGFLLIISAIWFGCFNASREVVKELPLYLRERAIGLNLLSYLGSKIIVLGLLCVLQCAALLSVTMAMTKFRPDAGIALADLMVTSFAGVMMGLLVSGLVDKEDKAMSLIPILLIPQVIFAGAFNTLHGLALVIARFGVIAYWSLDGLRHSWEAVAKNPAFSLRQDFGVTGLFLAGLTVATALVLKQKDPLK